MPLKTSKNVNSANLSPTPDNLPPNIQALVTAAVTASLQQAGIGVTSEQEGDMGKGILYLPSQIPVMVPLLKNTPNYKVELKKRYGLARVEQQGPNRFVAIVPTELTINRKRIRRLYQNCQTACRAVARALTDFYNSDEETATVSKDDRRNLVDAQKRLADLAAQCGNPQIFDFWNLVRFAEEAANKYLAQLPTSVQLSDVFQKGLFLFRESIALAPTLIVGDPSPENIIKRGLESIRREQVTIGQCVEDALSQIRSPAKSPVVKNNDQRKVMRYVSNIIIEHFGSEKPLVTMAVHEIQEFIAFIDNEYAFDYTGKIRLMMSRIYGAANSFHNLQIGNPMELVPKAKRHIPASVEAIKPPLLEALLKWLEDNDPEIIPWIVIQAFAAFRPSEAWEIEWIEICICDLLVKLPGLKAKGNRAIYREVEIAPVLVSWIQKYKKIDQKWIVPTYSNGEKVPYGQMHDRFKKALFAVGYIKEIPDEFLRKGIASAWVRSFEPLQKVNYWMGHSNPATLHRHYDAGFTGEEAKKYLSIFPKI